MKPLTCGISANEGQARDRSSHDDKHESLDTNGHGSVSQTGSNCARLPRRRRFSRGPLGYAEVRSAECYPGMSVIPNPPLVAARTAHIWEIRPMGRTDKVVTGFGDSGQAGNQTHFPRRRKGAARGTRPRGTLHAWPPHKGAAMRKRATSISAGDPFFQLIPSTFWAVRALHRGSQVRNTAARGARPTTNRERGCLAAEITGPSFRSCSSPELPR
jgi:hypothetical protein